MALSGTRGASSGCSAAEVVDELEWTIERCEEHLGVDRAGHYLRKFYPWYAERLELPKELKRELVTAPTTAEARAALDRVRQRDAAPQAA